MIHLLSAYNKYLEYYMRSFLLIGMIICLCSCSSNLKVVPRAFGGGPSPTKVCVQQGFPVDSRQHANCVNFYESQNNRNRRNIFLSWGAVLLAAFIFEANCDCLLGPDRGERFKP